MSSEPTPDHDAGKIPPPPRDDKDQPIDDAQLSLGAWLTRNATTLVLAAVVLVLIYRWGGLEGIWTIAKVAIGLSAVIFIHELGHFLVAKWCDVHVQTFSIGFGPALPGCSYQWGETTYKLALFPLGGYVKMVGEGGENDEEDTDPRSYKNKTVGQRMAIISAGVIMNILFGLVAFIAAFKIGVHQHAPVVGIVEAGGPAAQKGVRTGDVLERVDDISHPYFEDLKGAVMLTKEHQKVDFVFKTPVPGRPPEDWPSRSVSIEPRKTKSEPNPVIGIGWPRELKLPEKRNVGANGGPVQRNSAAAAGKVLNLKPDDEFLAATDPAHPDDPPTSLPQPNDFAALADRVRGLAGKAMQVKVRRDGQEQTLAITAEGFQFGDAIVGTTDPNGSNPFQTAGLRLDPRDPQGRHLDYFQFLDRMRQLADRPAVVQVVRKGAAPSEIVDVFVPPAYHQIIPGLRMEMGLVTGLRDGSDAAVRGGQLGDTITGVNLTDDNGNTQKLSLNPAAGTDEGQLDPLRLPFELRRWAKSHAHVKATLKVRRKVLHDDNATAEVTDLKWDSSWDDDAEVPLGANASLAIPELGIAYQVMVRVAHVDADSYAAQKGLRDGDFILGWSVQVPAKTAGDPDKWEKIELGSKNNPTGTADPGWAGVFARMQLLESPHIKLLQRHDDGTEEEHELDLQADGTWPLFDPLNPRGLTLFAYQDRIARADTLGEAVQMGMRDTSRTIVQIYMGLRSLVAGRVSATENLQGPIDIAVYAYATAESDWADFILLLGLISVNLAVVNFLPIPLLDGGHMVFLIYEKLRGKPASEHVRYASSLLGILVLASLMIFVIGLGVYRWIWPLIKGS